MRGVVPYLAALRCLARAVLCCVASGDPAGLLEEALQLPARDGGHAGWVGAGYGGLVCAGCSDLGSSEISRALGSLRVQGSGVVQGSGLFVSDMLDLGD